MLSIVGWYDNFLKSHFDLYRALAAAGAAPARRAGRGSTRTTSRRSRRAATGAVEFGPGGGLRASRSRRRSCSTGSTAGSRARTPAPPAACATGSSARTSGARPRRWPPPHSRAALVPPLGRRRQHARRRRRCCRPAAPRRGAGRTPIVYDPLDPVPTVGGKTLMPTIMTAGIDDQTAVEDRPDVLCYTSAPLTSAARRPRAGARSSCGRRPRPSTPTSPRSSSTSLPDGYAINLADGIVRARYRESPRRRSEPLEPGVPTRFAIDLWDLAHTFLPGHRLRLEISSSNFPRFDRNLNTGNEIGVDGAGGRGDRRRSSVFHDADAPERPRPAGRDRTRGGEVAMAQVENEIVAGFDALLAGAGDAERDAFFARCRAEAPIFFSEALGAWVLARYDDVRAVLEDHSYLTLTDGPGSPIYGRSMLQWEGVEHNKKSGPVVKRIRSPRAIRESIDGKVLEIATAHRRRPAARRAGRPPGRLRDAGAAARDHGAARHPRGREVPEHVRRDHEGRHLEHRRPVVAGGRLRGARQPARDRRSDRRGAAAAAGQRHDLRPRDGELRGRAVSHERDHRHRRLPAHGRDRDRRAGADEPAPSSHARPGRVGQARRADRRCRLRAQPLGRVPASLPAGAGHDPARDRDGRVPRRHRSARRQADRPDRIGEPRRGAVRGARPSSAPSASSTTRTVSSRTRATCCPFGAGRHHCAGSRLAGTEMVHSLQQLVRRAAWLEPQGPLPGGDGLLLRSPPSLPVVIHGRAS